MPLFRRLPLYKRLQSLRVRQPIRTIEVTDDEIRVERGGAWSSASWSHISNAVLAKQSYLPTRSHSRATIRKFTPEEAMALGDIRRNSPNGMSAKMGIVTSELLAFEIPGQKVSIDISFLTPHFERDFELRKLLLEKLHPHIEDQPFVSRMRSLFVIICMTLIIVVPLLYFFGGFLAQ